MQPLPQSYIDLIADTAALEAWEPSPKLLLGGLADVTNIAEKLPSQEATKEQPKRVASKRAQQPSRSTRHRNTKGQQARPQQRGNAEAAAASKAVDTSMLTAARQQQQQVEEQVYLAFGDVFDSSQQQLPLLQLLTAATTMAHSKPQCDESQQQQQQQQCEVEQRVRRQQQQLLQSKHNVVNLLQQQGLRWDCPAASLQMAHSTQQLRSTSPQTAAVERCTKQAPCPARGATGGEEAPAAAAAGDFWRPAKKRNSSCGVSVYLHQQQRQQDCAAGFEAGTPGAVTSMAAAAAAAEPMPLQSPAVCAPLHCPAVDTLHAVGRPAPACAVAAAAATSVAPGCAASHAATVLLSGAAGATPLGKTGIAGAAAATNNSTAVKACGDPAAAAARCAAGAANASLPWIDFIPATEDQQPQSGPLLFRDYVPATQLPSSASSLTGQDTQQHQYSVAYSAVRCNSSSMPHCRERECMSARGAVGEAGLPGGCSSPTLLHHAFGKRQAANPCTHKQPEGPQQRTCPGACIPVEWGHQTQPQPHAQERQQQRALTADASALAECRQQTQPQLHAQQQLNGQQQHQPLQLLQQQAWVNAGLTGVLAVADEETQPQPHAVLHWQQHKAMLLAGQHQQQQQNVQRASSAAQQGQRQMLLPVQRVDTAAQQQQQQQSMTAVRPSPICQLPGQLLQPGNTTSRLLDAAGISAVPPPGPAAAAAAAASQDVGGEGLCPPGSTHPAAAAGMATADGSCLLDKLQVRSLEQQQPVRSTQQQQQEQQLAVQQHRQAASTDLHNSLATAAVAAEVEGFGGTACCSPEVLGMEFSKQRQLALGTCCTDALQPHIKHRKALQCAVQAAMNDLPAARPANGINLAAGGRPRQHQQPVSNDAAPAAAAAAANFATTVAAVHGARAGVLQQQLQAQPQLLPNRGASALAAASAIVSGSMRPQQHQQQLGHAAAAAGGGACVRPRRPHALSELLHVGGTATSQWRSRQRKWGTKQRPVQQQNGSVWNCWNNAGLLPK